MTVRKSTEDQAMHLIWEKRPDAPKDKLMAYIRWVRGGGMTIEKINAEFEVSDKGVKPNRVWYKLT